jgi:putative nucleotidyltransferase with HDIG domain
MKLSGEQRAAVQEWALRILQRARDGDAEAVLPDREAALALMREHTQSESLRAHMLAVEAAMAAYARKLGEPEAPYRLAGLLHDFDYEANPDELNHPMVGCEILVERGYPAAIIEAILGHASYTGVARESQLARTLFAVDELTGLLTAVAYVRPSGLAGLKWKSFNKKFKTPSFAAGVNRDEVLEGAREIGVELRDHVLFLAESLAKAFPSFPATDET